MGGHPCLSLSHLGASKGGIISSIQPPSRLQMYLPFSVSRQHLNTSSFLTQMIVCLLTISAPASFLFSTLGLRISFHDAPPPGRISTDWLASMDLKTEARLLEHGMLVAELTSPASSSTDSELLIPGNAQVSLVLLCHVWVPLHLYIFSSPVPELWPALTASSYSITSRAPRRISNASATFLCNYSSLCYILITMESTHPLVE